MLVDLHRLLGYRVLVVVLIYVIMLSLQLRYLRNDLDDFYPNAAAGIGTILLSIANNMLHAGDRKALTAN